MESNINICLILLKIYPIFIYTTKLFKVSVSQLDKLKLAEISILAPPSKLSRSMLIIFLILLLISSFFAGKSDRPGENDLTNVGNKEVFHDNGIENNFGNFKGWFTENNGQIENSDVCFVYSGSEMIIGFQESGYILKHTGEENTSSIVHVTYEGSNKVSPVGKEELPHRSNFFIGNDSSKWRSNVHNYQKVVYEKLYDEIDLVFYSSEEGVKLDFIVYPGGNPGDIQFSYKGQDEIFTDNQGDLIVECPSGELIDGAPYCFQIENEERVEVASRYQVYGNEVSFDIQNFDPTKILVIDPLIFSTFIGGSYDDFGTGIALDNEKNICLIGTTASIDFPTTSEGLSSVNRGRFDVFISKLSPDGSTLLYSTYVGGLDRDYGRSIVLDSNNYLYITGHTSSVDFPTTFSSYDPLYNGGTDVFVSKISPDGSDLVYSTFIGGSEITAYFEPDEFGFPFASEGGYSIELDNENNVYITGITDSHDFPTTNGAYDTSYNGDGDCFVLKLNQDGSDLIFSTFIGGSDTEWFGGGFVLDSEYNVYVTGATSSEDFPTTPGCYDDSYNGDGADVIVFKLNPDGSDLVYSTYIGGDNWDRGWRIVVDLEANAYITGWTFSSDFPTTPGCFDNTMAGSHDIIVLKINQDGSDLIYSTLLGGSGSEWHSNIAIDSQNNVYISGSTFSDFPITPGSYDDSYNGGWDGVLSKLNSDGSELLYSTFIGGAEWDRCNALLIESENNAYIVGRTNSSDFPTTSGSYDNSHNGENDAFALKIDITPKVHDPDDNDNFPMVVLVLVGVFGLFSIGYMREDLRFLLFSLLALPLYSKIERDEVLDQPNRKKIYTCLHENPGINLTKIHRELDMGYGTLVHHLSILEKKKLITSEKSMGLKTFYPRSTKNHTGEGKNDFLLSPSQTQIIDFLKQRKSASRKNMQEALNMNPKTVGYHLQKLKEGGFIEQIGHGKYVTYQIPEEK